MKKQSQTYTINVLKNNKVKVRLRFNSENTKQVEESYKRTGFFDVNETHDGSIIDLLKSGTYQLLNESDQKKVKQTSGLIFPYAQEIAPKKPRKKMSKGNDGGKLICTHTQIIGAARDEEFELALETAPEPRNKEANLSAKRKADSRIISTMPKGKHFKHELKTASGVTICNMSTVNPELLEDSPPSKIRPLHRAVLPNSIEEIPIPKDITIASGLCLIREHRGITHTVLVNDDLAFIYNEKIYKTLTEISWEAAGYQISGNAFFGLPRKKRNAQ